MPLLFKLKIIASWYKAIMVYPNTVTGKSIGYAYMLNLFSSKDVGSNVGYFLGKQKPLATVIVSSTVLTFFCQRKLFDHNIKHHRLHSQPLTNKKCCFLLLFACSSRKYSQIWRTTGNLFQSPWCVKNFSPREISLAFWYQDK